MKTLSTILKIILKIVAIVLNTIILTICLILVARSEIGSPGDFFQWVLMILFFIFPPVSLITIVFSFLKRIKVVTNVLRVLGIILNVFFLTLLCCYVVQLLNSYNIRELMVGSLIFLIPPVINIFAIALPFRREEKITETKPKSTLNILTFILKLIVIFVYTCLLVIILLSAGKSARNPWLVWACGILIVTGIPITLITILKRTKTFITALKIISITLNVSLLICIISLAVMPVGSKRREIRPIESVIPEENLKIPEMMQPCAAKLLEIYAAIKQYEKDKGTLPKRLSDLVPNYIVGETLFCPNDPQHRSSSYPDPKLPCSYSYQFSEDKVPDGGGIVCRDWKMQQVKLFGDVVPIVRCRHHGSENIVNVSAGGRIYWSQLVWERMFMPSYQFGDERFVIIPRKVLLGEPAPSFTLQDLNGQQVSLSDFKGKVVLLDFWGTWCGPCRKAIPHIETLHNKYKDQGLVVIGMNHEREHQKVKEFAKDRISYIVLLDADEQFTEYGVTGIPTLFYIDREGKVRYCEVGFGNGMEKEMERKVKELLEVARTRGDKHVAAKQREIMPIESVIPEENLKIPEMMQPFAAKLREIYVAIKQYEKDKGTLPNRLSDLVPNYIVGETLFCPNDPEHNASYYPDPKLPCSYIYEFSKDKVPGGGGIVCRDWKMQQVKLFGDVVPIVRCMHHGSEIIVNVSVGGQIYWSQLVWERMFMPSYRFGDERFVIIPSDVLRGEPVDDFETYNDLDTTDPASNRIFNTWKDGYGTPTNGSIVGYENPPFCEQTIVHGGRQSMPLAYSNTAGATYSESERTFAVGQDWTKDDSQTLVLYFYVTARNTGQLYVKINGSKVVYCGDEGDIAKVQWQQWNIALPSLGVNLQNVTKLSIGIDGNGASGILYFDDILLRRAQHGESAISVSSIAGSAREWQL